MGGNRREALVNQPPNQVEHAQLVQYVEIGGGFVQQQHAGLLCQGPRDEDPLTFAPGKSVERSIGELLRFRELPWRRGRFASSAGPSI